MLEAKMWQQLKNIFPDCFLYRIENRTGKVPDIYFSIKNYNGWIELKNITEIKKGNIINVPFRPGQYPWIVDHLMYNKNIFLIGTIQNEWFIKIGSDIKETYYISDLTMLNIKNIITWILNILYSSAFCYKY